MPNPPRRKWLQLHLSTAVLLMFAVGAIIWKNVEERNVELAWLNPLDGAELGDKFFGWPFNAAMYRFVDGDGLIPKREPLCFLSIGVTLNIIVALAILSAVCFLSEWSIRRRNHASRTDH